MNQIVARPDEGGEYVYVLKCETDAINPSVILVLCLYDVVRQQMLTFSGQPDAYPIQVGVEIASLADRLIVHSDYAIRAVETLCGVAIDRERVIDTLRAAQLLTGPGGNGLSDFARRFGKTRREFRGAAKWSALAEARCQEDALLICEVFEHLQGVMQARDMRV